MPERTPKSVPKKKFKPTLRKTSAAKKAATKKVAAKKPAAKAALSGKKKSVAAAATTPVKIPAEKEEQPMREVHAPHEGVHSWKDVFIHIAIIVVGLLIAVGIDQTVVYFEHRHQLQEARAELADEQAENQVRLQLDLEQVSILNSELDKDMALLREHQRTHAPLTAKLDYDWEFYRILNGTWLTVQQNGTLSLMPYDEAKRNTFEYMVADHVMDALYNFSAQIEIAGAMARRSPDGNLSPHDTEELITATSEVQGRLDFTAKLLGIYKEGPPAPNDLHLILNQQVNK